MATEVIAFALPEAQARLAAAGVRIVCVVSTAPPAGAPAVGEARVVRVREVEGGVELVTAFPSCEIPPEGRGECS